MTDAPCHATDALFHAPSELLAGLMVQGADLVRASGGEALETAQSLEWLSQEARHEETQTFLCLVKNAEFYHKPKPGSL